MIRAHASRSLAAASRAPAARLAALPRRTYATIPDPQKPTDAPKPNDIPTSGGGSNTLALLVAGTAVLVGGWWYMQPGAVDPHAQRLKDQQELERKAQAAKDAGKATAHDAVRETEAGYEATKAAAKDKLEQARAEAGSAASDIRGKLDSVKAQTIQTYDSAKSAAASTVTDATRRAEATYGDAKRAAADAAHKVEAESQSWGQWLGSWFGYGKAKTAEAADDAKREAAQKVAAGAGKVEAEANKRA